MIPEQTRLAFYHSVERYRHANLLAASAVFDEASKHLRIDFFFAGTSEDVDLQTLEFGVVGEMVSHIWQSVETVGFAAVFDTMAGRAAALDPNRIYPN